MEQPGAARAATSPNSVENFINAKPAGAAAATRTVDSAAAKSRAQSLQASLAGRTQPFTAAWYTEHPNAWRYTHPYAEWWAVAGVAGLSSWLGYSVAAASVTTAGATTSSATTTTAQESSAETESAAAATAAPPADLEWLPLGVYATSPTGASQAHVYQQLAVSKQGELKGNYYDAISNAVQPIAGSIDRETRKASWTIGTNGGGAVFETTLDALVQTPSTATMKSGSSSQEWDLVQMEKPAGDTAKP